MDRVVLDTNIIIDYLSAKRRDHAIAVDLLETLLSSDDLEAIVPAGCIKDAYYILCRHYHSESLVRERLDQFRQLMGIADLTVGILDGAFASDEPDLEDAMVRVTAEELDARAIITRDEDAYGNSSVPAMDASAFLYQLDEIAVG